MGEGLRRWELTSLIASQTASGDKVAWGVGRDGGGQKWRTMDAEIDVLDNAA